MNPVTFANPIRLMRAQILPQQVTPLTVLPTEVRTCCLALASQVLQAPIQTMRPIEQFGRIVTVAIDPVSLPEIIFLDPVLPFPLVGMPRLFWSEYALYVGYLTSFLAASNDYWRQVQIEDARDSFDNLMQMAARVLRTSELGYFKARLLAAWAGDIAGAT